MKIKILSRYEVAQAVSMAEAIETVKRAFIQFSAGDNLMKFRNVNI